MWNQRAPQLLAMGCLAVTDGDALGLYCELLVVARRAAQLISQSDVLITSAEGRPMRNPALATLRDASHGVLQYAREFGLTPSARTQLHTPQGHIDPREELLS